MEASDGKRTTAQARVKDDVNHLTRWQDGALWVWCSLGVWISAMLIIAIGVAKREFGDRSLALCYETAVRSWGQCEAIYFTPTGFIYPPTFILVYWPFEALPRPLGEIAWRVIAALGIAVLLGRLMIRLNPARSRFDYLLLTAAILPVCLGAIQMGQANAAIAVCLLGAALALASERYWTLAILLALGFMIKPIVLAPIGLVVVLLRPHMILRLVACVGVALTLPFLTAPTEYVLSQYSSFGEVITKDCVGVFEHRFADFNGILRTFGIPLGGATALGIRVAAGLLLAGVVFSRRARMQSPERALFWLALSASYLMLFNPMTESNSYCMLAVPMALYAMTWIEVGRLWLGWGTLGALVLMGIGSEIFRPLFGNSFDLIALPTIALAFLSAVLAKEICTRAALQVQNCD